MDLNQSQLAAVVAATRQVPDNRRDHFFKNVADYLRPIPEPRDADVDEAIEFAAKRRDLDTGMPTEFLDNNPGSARQRRYRIRRRGGIMIVPVEIDFEFVDNLIDNRLLAEWDESDRKAIAHSLALIHREWRESVTRNASDSKQHANQSNRNATDKEIRHAARFYSETSILATDWSAYFETAWPRERALSCCPPRHVGTPRAHFWEFLRLHPFPPTSEQIERTLKVPT